MIRDVTICPSCLPYFPSDKYDKACPVLCPSYFNCIFWLLLYWFFFLQQHSVVNLNFPRIFSISFCRKTYLLPEVSPLSLSQLSAFSAIQTEQIRTILIVLSQMYCNCFISNVLQYIVYIVIDCSQSVKKYSLFQFCYGVVTYLYLY